MYAEKHALDNGAVVAGSRTVDGNGHVVAAASTVRGPDGSVRTVPSAPGTPQNPPTPGKAASIRSHSGSTSLPATQSNWQRRAGMCQLHSIRILQRSTNTIAHLARIPQSLRGASR
jgi:hypothetical protein